MNIVNLTGAEKKQLSEAYHQGNWEVVTLLFIKIKGGCPTCVNMKYIITWLDYWLAVGQLQKPTT